MAITVRKSVVRRLSIFPPRELAIYPVSTNLHVATRSHNITTACSLPEFGQVYVYFLLLQNYDYIFQQGFRSSICYNNRNINSFHNNIYKLYMYPVQEN